MIFLVDAATEEGDLSSGCRLFWSGLVQLVGEPKDGLETRRGVGHGEPNAGWIRPLSHGRSGDLERGSSAKSKSSNDNLRLGVRRSVSVILLETEQVLETEQIKNVRKLLRVIKFI
ncbi:hypothetical protein FH972_027231 [Carpinus fangiana]|uniref:Uncharacterized protein n=1 Tax=Carpinus fangiana TaxID=176857 RepID=A0A5N6L6D8_9ROSI|nr:hypothetical protein FH972_027231 [Carpinus fangiana]